MTIEEEYKYLGVITVFRIQPNGNVFADDKELKNVQGFKINFQGPGNFHEVYIKRFNFEDSKPVIKDDDVEMIYEKFSACELNIQFGLVGRKG
jgi:hypothetical protein